MSQAPISPLRRRMIEDMTVRGFGEKTQSDYIRHVRNFTLFLGRSPDHAQPEDLRLFQVHQRERGVRPRIEGGTVRPSALAVLLLRLMSNFTGSWTGRFAGVAPRRMRST
jgi:hypothetical protein